MAMPQRDDTIEAIKRLDALLEYTGRHNDKIVLTCFIISIKLAGACL